MIHRADVTITGATLAAAESKATTAIDQFFGSTEWVFETIEAEADITVSGVVIGWAVHFVAVKEWAEE